MMFALRSVLGVGSVLGLGLAAIGCGELPEADEVAWSEDALRRLQPNELVGTIGFGETKAVDHPADTTYRAYAFDATAGDEIELGVVAESHDAMLWVLGLRGETLTKVNAFADGREETVTHRITTSGRYFVGFREADYEPARFIVRLAKKQQPPQPPPAPMGPSCTTPNVAGCGQVVTLRADDHYWYTRISHPGTIGSYGDLWVGTLSGDFSVSGLGSANGRLEDDRGARTDLFFGSKRTVSGLSARSEPVTAVGWGGRPGTADETGVTIWAQNVTYMVERTREIEERGVLPFEHTFGAELHGLSVAFDIEVETEDHFAYPCPVMVGDSPDPERPLVTRELGRFTGSTSKRSFIATPPIKIEGTDYHCGDRKTYGPDLWYRITNVRIFRP